MVDEVKAIGIERYRIQEGSRVEVEELKIELGRESRRLVQVTLVDCRVFVSIGVYVLTFGMEIHVRWCESQ